MLTFLWFHEESPLFTGAVGGSDLQVYEVCKISHAKSQWSVRDTVRTRSHQDHYFRPPPLSPREPRHAPSADSFDIYIFTYARCLIKGCCLYVAAAWRRSSHFNDVGYFLFFFFFNHTPLLPHRKDLWGNAGWGKAPSASVSSP